MTGFPAIDAYLETAEIVLAFLGISPDSVTGLITAYINGPGFPVYAIGDPSGASFYMVIHNYQIDFWLLGERTTFNLPRPQM